MDLTFELITADRPHNIDRLINSMGPNFYNGKVKLLILDGSKDNKTETVVKRHNFSYILYKHYPGTLWANRVRMSLDLCNTEYLCLLGDKNVPTPENFSFVMEKLDEEYDILIFSSRDRKGIHLREYNQIEDMFKDNAWEMTQTSDTIIKVSSFRKEILYNLDFDNFYERSFPHIRLYFDGYVDKGKFRGFYSDKPITYVLQEAEKTHHISELGNAVDVWIAAWIYNIECLDDRFDKYKKQVMLDHGIYSGLNLNCLRGFFSWRWRGQLNKEKVKQNDKSFRKATTVNIFIIYLIAMFPKWILNIIGSILSKSKESIH